ncbi:MAG: hypothetical protein WDA27_12950 [Actinomycetota bacterium]
MGVDIRDRRSAALVFLDECNVTHPSLYNHGAVVACSLSGEDVLNMILDEEIR